jgi:hypothetical protein
MVVSILDVLAKVRGSVADPSAQRLDAMKAILALEPTMADLDGAKGILLELADGVLRVGAEELKRSDLDHIRWIEESFQREADRDSRVDVVDSVRRLLYRMSDESE